MTRFKFRAWDDQQKEWITDCDLYMTATGEVYFGDINNPPIVHVKQEWVSYSTGLKDMYGKEIYEGDVLKIPDFYETPENTNATYHHEQIVFKDGAFCTHNYPMFEYQQYLSEESEVIGNKYEHPHLLESEDDL
ncbi:YopX family protein [uncultured Exiguobacterium sp.]|uniref:YopX family protein n=1 Tax=uncultured Exiguobacterium sp. TaxID=202669 RepID=UPI0025CBAF59|nr:YopX family protein [uncultured Exiguobacterium sp.]